ncbi:MAG: CpsD/CapB family tyrosine-protein kinase [Clostridium chrysemydis]|uniref:CpsD/CapB family tyrosine-protein kinase n=1 Tax=Clostridium TaxID=1485 RepID=UPI0021526C8F|nr:CpsD/CapB family tyrosine-protein kinase [Clostridium sp. LY3-2]MCR6513724.1 CpsD/CapB family tyrosine-protein kinase [Clostridium sp. LY3-2]
MLIVEAQPKSISAEKYRVLRTNIQYSSIDKEIRRIVVTSAEPGEGKSTTAGNLALAFSQDNKKVLLIDCDLRKPSVHKKFKISNSMGLSDVIINREKIQEAIQERNENLDVLSAGKLPPNPSELLGSVTMDKLLEYFETIYDVIILDSPPLHAVTDAQILSKKSDGLVLVVRAEKTKKDSVLAAKALLEKVNAPILGVVLNGGESTKEKYYYYYGH